MNRVHFIGGGSPRQTARQVNLVVGPEGKMYGLYEKSCDGGIEKYRFVEEVSLFGCNVGYIPDLLRRQLTPADHEPFTWHVNIEQALKGCGKVSRTFVIDLKPKNAAANLSLYEVADVWGYSDSGWTPIMMRLRSLFIDYAREANSHISFERRISEIDDPIFSMMYLSGSVEQGQIVGRWTPPGASPTNSVLLWPETFSYFAAIASPLIQASAQQGAAVDRP